MNSIIKTELVFLLFLATSMVFTQNSSISIDSTTQEKTIYFDSEGTTLGGYYEVYYANGRIKEMGQTLNEFGCWMNSGKFSYFNKDGILAKTEFYNNWLENGEDGCHSIIHDISVNEYHENGKLKAEKMYQSAYESLDTIKVSVWRYYSSYGYIAKTEVYPWHFTHKSEPNDIQNAEKALVNLFEDLKSFDPQKRFIETAPAFEKQLLVALNLQNSWHYSFKELANQISILSSKDSLIRTFAWDEMEGGSYHNMKSYIQYQHNDTLKIINLRANEEINGFRNAVIDEIVAFDNGYFIVGWGTFGGGAMHLIITYYKFDDGELKPWPIFEDNMTEFGIEISRADKFNLKIDSTHKQITFNENLYNEDKGFYYQTGKLTTLEYDNQLKLYIQK